MPTNSHQSISTVRGARISFVREPKCFASKCKVSHGNTIALRANGNVLQTKYICKRMQMFWITISPYWLHIFTSKTLQLLYSYFYSFKRCHFYTNLMANIRLPHLLQFIIYGRNYSYNGNFHTELHKVYIKCTKPQHVIRSSVW